MADSKVTALTELTSFSGDEEFYVVDDDDGTPASRRMTIENLAAGLAARSELTAAFLAGTVLASTVYNPGTTQTISATSGTFVDVDATNLAVTFTAPSTGNVKVTLVALAGTSTSTALSWCLREGSSDITGTDARVTNNLVQARVAHSVIITGLTPGASHTYKWGHARSSGSGNAQTIYGGGIGAALMEVAVAL